MAAERKERTMGNWQTVLNVSDVEPFPGVYALYREGGLLYIGQSQDLSARLRAHGVGSACVDGRALLKEADLIKIRYSKKRFEEASLELALISRLRPAANKRIAYNYHLLNSKRVLNQSNRSSAYQKTLQPTLGRFLLGGGKEPPLITRKQLGYPPARGRKKTQFHHGGIFPSEQDN